MCGCVDGMMMMMDGGLMVGMLVGGKTLKNVYIGFTKKPVLRDRQFPRGHCHEVLPNPIHNLLLTIWRRTSTQYQTTPSK